MSLLLYLLPLRLWLLSPAHCSKDAATRGKNLTARTKELTASSKEATTTGKDLTARVKDLTARSKEAATRGKTEAECDKEQEKGSNVRIENNKL